MAKRQVNSTQPASSVEANHCPGKQEIAARAYEIFLARGGHPGNDLDDWLQAERELTEKSRRPVLVRFAAAH